MLPQIEYFRPRSLDEALMLLAGRQNSKILAGGTDLLVELRKHNPDEFFTIIDITAIDSLRFIRDAGDKVLLGPLVTHKELSESELIRREFPFLSLSASTVGSPQIRARGTIGGNICNASPAADTVPVLVALDAIVTLESATGKRECLVEEFITKPYRTLISPGEILTKIYIGKLPPGAKSSFIKLGRRNALAISRMNVASVLLVEDGLIKFARLACGSVFPVTQRVNVVEEFLLGKEPSVELFRKAGELVAEEMVKVTGVRWSTPYKKPVIAALVRRALCECAGLEVK